MPSREPWEKSLLCPRGSKMIKEDFITQSEVRRMLIRANIDYTKVDFGTVRG